MADFHKPIRDYFMLNQYTGNQSSIQNQFHSLAHGLDSQLIAGPEKSVAMRKLLESFDAAMRAAA